MTGARYGALGVLDLERKGLAEFITVGLDPDEEDRIGPRQTGRGLLGLLVATPEPLRLAVLSSHAESFGFPPGHPPMTSFLGVPIKVRDEVYGNLYLTDKAGWSEFTQDDEALVTALAVVAGIALENANLHREVRSRAVYDDRERLAQDLHDMVIQRFFGAGLALQGIAGVAQAADVAERLNEVIADIDDSIRQLRSIIFELGLIGDETGPRASIVSLLRDLRLVTGFDVHSSFEGSVVSAISDTVAEHVLATIREAVTNVGRHAHATKADVRLSAVDGRCRLAIVDDGRGFDPSKTSEGALGLTNVRRRAEKLNGSFDVDCLSAGGTTLTWDVPLAQETGRPVGDSAQRSDLVAFADESTPRSPLRVELHVDPGRNGRLPCSTMSAEKGSRCRESSATTGNPGDTGTCNLSGHETARVPTSSRPFRASMERSG